LNCGNDDDSLFRWGGTLEGSGEKRFRCKKCGTWGNTGQGKQKDMPEEEQLYTFVDEGQTAYASATLDKDVVNSPAKLLKAMNIDENVWMVYKKQIGKAPAWRKDREVRWDVVDNHVANGKVRDSGKIKIVPVYTVKLWLKRRTEEIRAGIALDDFKRDVYRFAPKVVQLKFPKSPKGMLYEIEMPDIHIGKLTWGEESGEDGDLRTQVDVARKVAQDLLSHTKHYPVEKILFPIGHDFYNVDNNLNTTTHGTPQQEDTRWRKSFKAGWQLASELINMCAQVAPVDVLVVGGNHDEQRSFYLGEVLSAIYSNSKRVNVDNSAKLRKYYTYGNVLLGLTHGYHEKIKELKDIMLYEAKPLLANAKYIEWHTGDKHHKEDYVHKTHEANNGIVVRILRSLTTTDAWHYNKGYVGALRASEAFLWDREAGLKAQFTAIP
jgi:hypothetical protein